MFEVCQQTCLQIEQYLHYTYLTVSGANYQAVTATPYPAPNWHSRRVSTFRITNLSPKWFFAILFKPIQTFDDQKSEEDVCVSELRLDKNDKRTQFTPIFES